MRAFKFFFVIFATLSNVLYWPAAFGNTLPTPITTNPHPRICVVLSGGGARGFAHIGVLKYLEEQHIPVDCIAGTSMGAVVGGLYASGMSASDIEQSLDEIHLGNVALDIVDRRKLSESLRQDDANYPISGTFGLTRKGLTLPLGAVQGNQFLEILQNWTSHLPLGIEFDKLSIPFRAVATDLETGQMVVFDKGSIATAIRASMAAPGVFSPIEINGRLLTDGGLVRNLPVDIARGMGADVIIAVNIGTPLLPRDDLNSFVNISQQMLNILTEQNVNEQKKILGPDDVLIDANLGDISFLDFNRAKEAFTIGYRSAEALHERLARLSVSLEDYVALQHTRPDPQIARVKIGFVDVHSKGNIPTEDIRRQLGIQIGAIYDAADINNRITPLIESRQYDSVNHTLVERDGEYGVEIDATERRWGPNFLRLGLELTTGFDGISGFELQLGHRLPWINSSGLEWRNDLQFGNTYGIRSELRQPLIQREGMYLAPYVDANFETLSIYSGNDRVAEYSVQSTQLGVDVGVPLGDYGSKGEVRSGLYATHYSLRPKLGGLASEGPNGSVQVFSFASEKMDELAFHSRFIVDQLDARYFPSAGYRFGGELITGFNRNSSDRPELPTHEDFRGFQQLNLDGAWAKSFGDSSINLSMKLGSRKQSGPAIPGIGLSLGGFQQLTAYQPDQFFGNYLLYGNATYLFRAVNFDMAGQAFFAGTSLEIGNVADRRSDFDFINLKKSLSIFVGAKTFMGPIHFGIAAAPSGTYNIFLQLGRQ